MSVSIGIDYLQGMARFSTVDQFEIFLSKIQSEMLAGDNYYLPGGSIKAGKKFTNKISSVKGAFGGFNLHENYVDCHIQLPGEICREFKNQLKALKLFKSEFRVTRIDLAVDDFSRRISQEGVRQVAERGHYKGIDSFRYIGSKGNKEEEKVGTCVFGKSDKILKFYNAEFMHEIEADRWELLLRNDYSEVCAEEIIKAESVQKGGAFLGGAIDFIDPGKNWYQDRRYQFWQSLLDDIGEAKLRAPRESPTLERSIDWLERQVSPTLSVLLNGLGYMEYQKFMKRLAERATDRLSEHHLAWIEHLKNSSEVIS